jgi:hypothetical protein
MKQLLIFLCSIASCLIHAHEWYQVKAKGQIYPLSTHAVQRIHERAIDLINLSNLLADGVTHRSTENTELVVNTNTGYGAVVAKDTKLIVTVMNGFTEAKLERKLKKLQALDPQTLQQKDILYLKHTAIIPPTKKSLRKKLIKSMNSRKGDEPYYKRARGGKKIK